MKKNPHTVSRSKQPQSKSEVYRISFVSASTLPAEGDDHSARDFLEEARFPKPSISLANRKSATSDLRVFLSGTAFIIEMRPLSTGNRQVVPFEIARLDAQGRTVVDQGSTVCIGPSTEGKPSKIEIIARGDGIKDWSVVCRKASADIVKMNEEYKLRPPTVSDRIEPPPLEPFGDEELALFKRADTKASLQERKSEPNEKQRRRASFGPRSDVASDEPSDQAPPAPPVPTFPGSAVVRGLVGELTNVIARLEAVSPEQWESALKSIMHEKHLSGFDGVNLAAHALGDRLKVGNSKLSAVSGALTNIKLRLLRTVKGS